MNKELNKVIAEYESLMKRQIFDENDLDYSILDKYFNLLKYLDELENSAFEIFDLYKRKHLYYSPKFSSMLGFDISGDIEENHHLIDSKIHPDDAFELFQIGNYYMRMMLEVPIEERKSFKLFTEFRILNGREEYIRVIKQYVALELDKKGNVWLGLNTINISPDNDINKGVKSRAVNIKTGEIFLINAKNKLDKLPLSERELEILEHVAKGFSSKQIAEILFISSHTVNTHRQRIIEKLGVSNTQEAVAELNKYI